MEGAILEVRRVLTASVLCAACLLLLVSGAGACSGTTCGECIAYGAECAWCVDANFTSVRSERCDTPRVLRDKGCRDIEDPRPKKTTIRDDQVTDGRDGTGDDAIQLQPQQMHLTVRPRGKGVYFDATFRAAKNFPVDLYFLFDVSATMKSSVQELSTLADKMTKAIRNISTNYRLGYGIFQDKVILPFTSTHPVKLENPYPKGNAFAPAFAFNHLLSMTDNLEDFRNRVDDSLQKITGNLDRPEGGFDAIMQAIACQQMGWRDNSRQLIIFASDDRMHYAGDGKLAGLITPNDCQCHLTPNNSNAMSEVQDYPSLGQLSWALDQSKKYVIFAIKLGTAEWKKQLIQTEYKSINSRVKRSTFSELSADNSIAKIVEEKYREMTKGVQLEQEVSSDNIEVMIMPKCEQREGTSCTGLQIGKEVEFRIEVRAKTCPANRAERVQNVTIAPSDFRRDKLFIQVEILCDCDCYLGDDVSQMVPNDECSHGNGTLECGVCRCFEGRAGSTCECSQKEDDFSLDRHSSACREGGSNSSTECSGTGECVCGQCSCLLGFSGEFCQCNSKLCPVRDGLVCTGNGECDCEQCRCVDGYTGIACQCPTSHDVCIPIEVPEGQERQVCSGNGQCTCDEYGNLKRHCACYAGYKGTFCQECVGANCTNPCNSEELLKQCAACHVQPDLEFCQALKDQCPDKRPVKKIDAGVSGKRNVVQTGNGCATVFSSLQWHSNHSINATDSTCAESAFIYVQEEECPPPPDLLIVVLGIVGGVVFVGLLLLLLWKALTMLFDKMEYAHFARELKTHKWAKQVNPLYKGASTTYYNPIVDRAANKADDM